MTNFHTMICESLHDIGLGPNRVTRAADNETLYGTGGLLNSIELVQFVAALSDRSGVEAFELMEHFRGEDSIFGSFSRLQAYFEARAAQQTMAG
ncbi:hypothetical protein CLV80_108125 [Yoonia maritima]|uniref:Carrier domain-containing protein n=1 Tax=Yoonia maritima TaxID=1435347 RepID=A0A2T0VXG0_9RHOB|nr:hypothetical protein [Yoonia maritima]PRY76661.1 hypothetical protein CLV80_108125 [Yoonia maritima]